MKKLLIACTLMLMTAGTMAQTNVPALILSNQVWTKAGSPYLINQNVYVDTGIKVTVMPGVEVKSTGNYTLYVDGEFQALGKKDSVVKFDKVKFDFSKVSTDYNDTTKKGALFRNAHLTGNGPGTMTITLRNTSIRVDSCRFTNSYYSLYCMTLTNDNSLIWVTDSYFAGDSYSEGSPLYSSGISLRWLVENNTFTNARSNYIYGSEIVFRKNLTYNLKSTYYYVYGPSDIYCNKFIKMQEGIRFYTFYSNAKPGFMYFWENTLDSMGGGFTDYPMVQLYKNSSGIASKITPAFNNNNFLKALGTAGKVRIYASNATPTVTDKADFRFNYWGTTDSATIESMITDYNDDVTIYGRVDFSKYASTANKMSCWSNSCNRPDFDFVQTDSGILFINKTKGSNPYYVHWDLGDGNTSSSKTTFHHIYNNNGTYQVCLYLYDSLTKTRCDSVCKSVYQDVSTCKASFYFATDTSVKDVIYIIHNSKGVNARTRFFWFFGDTGGSTKKSPTHTYAKPGRYSLCLMLEDTASRCYSWFCDSVSIAGIRKKLVVIDQSNVLKQNTVNTSPGWKVYPNPSRGELNIRLQSANNREVTATLLDLTGKSLISCHDCLNNGNAKIQWDISSLRNGVYVLRLNWGGQITTERILLNR